jgi:hypothetical protein
MSQEECGKAVVGVRGGFGVQKLRPDTTGPLDSWGRPSPHER